MRRGSPPQDSAETDHSHSALMVGLQCLKCGLKHSCFKLKMTFVEATRNYNLLSHITVEYIIPHITIC